jgi:aldehyde:ferredoxin oxidoreductase
MEEREKFVQNWVATPHEKFKEWFLRWEKRNEISNEASCAITDWNEAMHYIDDSLGLCGFVSSFRGQFGGKTGYHVWNIPQLISLTTGVNFDKDRVWECFQRIRTLVRAVNVRRGLRRKDERPPEDHWAVRNEEFEQRLLDEYYDFKGWSKDGIPTKETLDKLGLNYVSEDFVKRGTLTGNGCAPSRETSKPKEEQMESRGA